MAHNAFSRWMMTTQQHIELTLEHYLPNSTNAPQHFHSALRYAALSGGKRLRALLVCAAGELVEAEAEILYTIAAAVEFMHAYSLVHDDMPALDNDVLRRGKPSCHVAFGEACALLVGDTLQTLAFDVLSRPFAQISSTVQLAMVQQFAHAAGYAGMAGGQAVDLESVGQSISLPELEYMHLLKTGALIRASVLMGAMAGANRLDEALSDKLDYFAKRIGLAFQVVDDVLDYEADTDTLGKTAGKDAAASKPTYVSLMGLGAAKGLVQELKEDALDALKPFGRSAQRLDKLAEYMINRSF